MIARLLTSSDAYALGKLRQEVFLKAQGFTVDPHVLPWSKEDDKSYVLGAFHQDELVSTMRLQIHRSFSTLHTVTDFDGIEKTVQLPSGVLGKAATQQNFQSKGFNTYLRYLGFTLAKEMGIKEIIGTIIDGAPRMEIMKKLGYKFYENPTGWHRYGYYSKDRVLLATLDLEKKYDQAIDFLKSHVRELEEQYPFVRTHENILRFVS